MGRADLDGARKLAEQAWALAEKRGAEFPDLIVVGGTLALQCELAGEADKAKSLEQDLRARLEADNALLASKALQTLHRRWTVALLAKAKQGRVQSPSEQQP